ncbi:MAG: hypothetical protein KDK45_10730, partial [Leptospiraceae bacterium]|nr:hypothetical protein [Leptospiraceae bacterium]
LQIAEKNLSVKLNGILEQHEELLNSFEPSKENCVEIEKSMHPRVTINFGKNKIFHSELRTYDGRNYIYLADDMLPILTSVPPKKPKKDKEKK